LALRLPPAAIESTGLCQAIVNILTNAVQSIPGSGTIQLKTVYAKSEESIHIFCKDDGMGIPKESLSRIFEPFYTTKNKGLEKNSGLGLSIVHALVNAAKGTVQITSSLKHGTCVRIQLPIHKGSSKK